MPKIPKFSLSSLKARLPMLKFDMMMQMQLKFVAVAMAILIGVFLIMLSTINMMMQTVSQHQSMKLLRQIAESDRYNTLETSDEFIPEPMGEPPVPPEGIPEPMAETHAVQNRVIEVQQLANRNWWEEETQNGTYWWENEDLQNEDWQNPDWENDWQDRPQQTEMTEEQRPERPTRPSWEEWPPETMPPRETMPPETFPTTPPAPPTEPETTISATLPPTDPPTEPLQTEEAPPEEVPVVVQPTVPEEITTAEETTTTTTTTVQTTTTTVQTTTTPPPIPPARPNKWNITITIDHFALLVGHNGEFLGLRNTEDYTAEEAEAIMTGIRQMGEQSGMYGWLQYYSIAKEYGTLIVVTDKTSDQGLLNNLFRITVIVGCIMLFVLFVILCILSKWITKPVQTAFKRQKQFVSDAGHELKTPLTVLSANADILQDEIGENKWLCYMQEQTARMNQLVGDLLSLARMDNATQEYELVKFNLSAAVNATALPFESQAFEMHKNLELDIQSGVEYCGSEKHIRQLAAIFIDNAMKYSNENGTIKITLLKRGDKAVLEFYNTGCEISQKETEKIFERFYRGDKARNNQGKSGYGLGLAIAKSIMDVHKIKIQVTCEQGKWIRFLLTM